MKLQCKERKVCSASRKTTSLHIPHWSRLHVYFGLRESREIGCEWRASATRARGYLIFVYFIRLRFTRAFLFFSVQSMLCERWAMYQTPRVGVQECLALLRWRQIIVVQCTVIEVGMVIHFVFSRLYALPKWIRRQISNSLSLCNENEWFRSRSSLASLFLKGIKIEHAHLIYQNFVASLSPHASCLQLSRAWCVDVIKLALRCRRRMLI